MSNQKRSTRVYDVNTKRFCRTLITILIFLFCLAYSSGSGMSGAYRLFYYARIYAYCGERDE